MTIERAVEVLNERRHINYSWRIYRGRETVAEAFIPDDEEGWDGLPFLTAFEAIAVAEKYEREDPNGTCDGGGAYADDCDCPSLASEVALVLEQLDHLAEVIGDEGVFRSCRDHLRSALAKEQKRSNA